MRPANIDWQEATLAVRGNGRRDVHLPLPQDAGDAVLDYVEHACPEVVAIDRGFLESGGQGLNPKALHRVALASYRYSTGSEAGRGRVKGFQTCERQKS